MEYQQFKHRYCMETSERIEIWNAFLTECSYPGFARDHIIAIGDNPPEVIQFVGAVGNAYHRLYTPLMSYKDELQLLKG
ncbi:hypothetical protein GCM10011607_31470 [Shewanella inventionis]|uniref:Uncharacterized protein n=2 Tax=Shewanella inventionis TaxID=1738770 RepID=A0ABQ1JKG9_9GAMM|nr:hypothetical protein GCM10011607_31470 [Shewanella inventionis]